MASPPPWRSWPEEQSGYVLLAWMTAAAAVTLVRMRLTIQTADDWLGAARASIARTRSGDRYKPSGLIGRYELVPCLT